MEDVLILGAGRVGSEIARALAKDNCNVNIVDVDANRLLKLQSSYDLRTVQGTAADPQILKQAAVNDASIVVAVTSIDEVNLVACKICRLLSPTIKTIARIRSSQYGQSIIHEGFDINESFCPEELVAKDFSNAIVHPGCLSVHHFASGQLTLAGIRITSKADVSGNSIGDLRNQIKEIDYRIVALYRDDEYVSPQADTHLFVGDEIYLLVATENLSELTPFLAGKQKQNKRIFIAGGGSIGRRVATALENDNDVKILDISRDRCRVLSQQLSRSLILKGRATDENLLLQENINETDIFCALTNDDEENILSAMLAKRLGAKKTAVLINRLAYADILERQLDIVLSPSQITIGSVLPIIRPGDFQAVHSLRHGSAEAVEFTVHGSEETSKLTGREIQQVAWPQGTGTGAILRGEEVIIAHDETVICEEDRVICFVANREAVKAMEKLIQVGLEYTGKRNLPPK